MKRENVWIREYFPSKTVFDDKQRIPKQFPAFFKEKILPALLKTAAWRKLMMGYKVAEKKKLAMRMILQVIKSRLIQRSVADTRSLDKAGARLRISVWDALKEADFVVYCIGSENSKMMTRYLATDKLLDLNKRWELSLLEDLKLGRNTELAKATRHALVVLMGKKTDPETGKPIREVLQLRDYLTPLTPEGVERNGLVLSVLFSPEYIHGVETVINRINEMNLDHSWKAYTVDPESGKRLVFQPNVEMRQVHSGGDMYRAMRFYSFGLLSGQNLSKSVRKSMKIDGERVAELDYAGLHTRLLYHLLKHDPPKGDVYRPEMVFRKFYALRNASDEKKAILRTIIKKAPNVCWNVESRGQANSAVGKLIAKHPESSFVWDCMNLENLSPRKIVSRIMKAHPLLAARTPDSDTGQFFTCVGMRLMTIDGFNMLKILEAFAKADKPALGIHDSVVCKRSDVAFARKTMRKVYTSQIHFPPVISRVY